MLVVDLEIVVTQLVVHLPRVVEAVVEHIADGELLGVDSLESRFAQQRAGRVSPNALSSALAGTICAPLVSSF